MRYGLPYKGSKNAIAEWIVTNLPAADTFCDLFMGGGAITHCAMTSGKYKHFVINDIDSRLPEFFIDCINGKYTPESHTEWITREEFNLRKETDAYIALVWSFGNNGKDYLYGTDIEDIKHAYHNAVYFGDVSGLQRFGFKISAPDQVGIYDRYLALQRQIKAQIAGAQQEIISRQSEIERLQRLKNLQCSEALHGLSGLTRLKATELQPFGIDYQAVPIPENSLIYCDIPYLGTNCGKYGGFDHERFYNWAWEQDNIYISEYRMPEDFIEVANISKSILSAANGNSNTAEEKIFTNRRTYDKLSADVKERISFDTAKQTTLFDMGYCPCEE